ncbi:MAG: rhomboid family intramembrane serine protease [Isosphaeraceae bacterium]|nr:rhomboid family intramembrane serine protease [Isosphaeraceae bacterium]
MVLPLGDVESTRIVPVATYLLIAINVAIYVLQVDQGEAFTITYAATPFEITHDVDLIGRFGPAGADDAGDMEQAAIGFPIWLTLFTSLFLHGSPLHLAGNMLYLWIFGDNVEEVLGTFLYLAVYVACGVVGTLCQVAAAPDSVIPTLGASGAIAGLMAIYLLWFPHNRIRVLVLQFITEMPAIFVIGFWIVSQLILGYNSAGHIGVRGGVAYLAHIGGAATGFATGYLFESKMMAFRAAEYDRAWFNLGAGSEPREPHDRNW